MSRITSPDASWPQAKALLTGTDLPVREVARTAGLRGRDRHHPPVPQVRGHHARRLPCAAQMKRKSAFFHRSRRFVRQNPKSKQPAFFRNITSGGKRAVFSQGPGRKTSRGRFCRQSRLSSAPFKCRPPRGRPTAAAAARRERPARRAPAAVRPEQQTRGVQRRQHKVRAASCGSAGRTPSAPGPKRRTPLIFYFKYKFI